MYTSALSTFILLIATIAVIVFAYYATIIIGKRTNKLLNSRYVQILERTALGLNTNITILKIDKKIYIVLVQGKTTSLLDIIDEKNWELLKDVKQFNIENNSHIFNNMCSKIKKFFTRDNRNGSDNNE